MTIRLRNRLIRALFYFFVAVLGISCAFYFLQIFRNRIFENPNFIRQNWNMTFSFSKPCFWASVAANGFLLVYEIVICFFLFKGFEKTQSQEVCFLACFLIGCCAESIKLWVPVFNTYTGFSKMLIFAGDATILSRFLATLSLFFCALFSGQEQRQNLEQNIIIVLGTAFFISIVLPLNTADIQSNFKVNHSFSRIVEVVQIIINLITLMTVYLNNRRDGVSYWGVVGLFLLMGGFYIVAGCSVMLWLVFGAGFMIAGMVIYLKILHRIS